MSAAQLQPRHHPQADFKQRLSRRAACRHYKSSMLLLSRDVDVKYARKLHNAVSTLSEKVGVCSDCARLFATIRLFLDLRSACASFARVQSAIYSRRSSRL